MFRTLTTLIVGAQARSEDRVRDVFAIELIDQKIRESEAGLRAAKGTLAALIQRQRAEQRQADQLATRIADLTLRARDALAAGLEGMATEAATAIAQMENEMTLRRQTLDRLETRVVRLTASVESGHRRIVDLKQGAIQARAVRREQDIQGRIAGPPAGAADEAEELITRVLGRDDPFENSEILREIDRGLNHDDLADRMADQGLGPATRATAASVLARLKAH